MHKDVNEFLRDAKAKVRSCHRRFIPRNDRDMLQDFIDLGISKREDAWRIILQLSASDESQPNDLDKDGSGKRVWFFRRMMENGVYAYIKLKIDERGCVCISFHPVEYGEYANQDH